MKSATLATTTRSCTIEDRASLEGGPPLRIGALIQERDALQEEVRQLRAAVEIYAEVLRRLRVKSPQRAA